MSNLENEERFKYVPYSEQEEPVKIHRIRLDIDFPPLKDESLDYVGLAGEEVTPCCHSALKSGLVEWAKGPWKAELEGGIMQLQCIVPNIPAIVCECKESRYFDRQTTWPAEVRIRAIKNYFEFYGLRSKEEYKTDYEAIAAFLTPEDILKVQEFARVLKDEGRLINRINREYLLQQKLQSNLF